MNITPLKVTVREVVTGYVDDSDREEGIYGYSGRLNIRPKYQRAGEATRPRFRREASLAGEWW